MRIIFSKEGKRRTIIFICLLLFAVVLLNAGGYLLNIKHVGIFATITEIDKYKVQSQLLMNAMNEVGVCQPERAAEVWASGLMKRSAALQYSVMTKELKDEYAQQLQETFPNWVTGMSSPWVQNFTITKVQKLDENSYVYHLRFSTQTSTGPAGDYNAVLTIAREGSFWRITKISMDNELYAYTGFNPGN